MASGNLLKLVIETHHGATLELQVLPVDTIFSIKLRVSLDMGIPVSQQHLIWRCQELPNKSSLIDCNITNGSTLKLVLGMRGGTDKTRKASAGKSLSISGVFKNDEKQLHEASRKKDRGLNAPRPRAKPRVMVRQLVNRGSGSSRRSFSDQSARGLRGKDSASESRWHRENLVMRQKVELLQQKLKSCRLRKRGGSGSPDERLVLALKPVFESEYELHTGQVLPDSKEVPEIETGAKTPAEGDMSAEQVYELFPSPKTVQKTRKQFCHDPGDDCWINPDPDTLLPQWPFARATSRILSEEKNNPERQSTGAGPSAGFNTSAPVPQVASFAATAISRSAYESPKENCETGENSQEPSQSQLHPLKGKTKLAKRCVKCNRKIGLASTYVCRCGNNFCAAHRYAELHHCDYDYKAEGRRILQNSNHFIKGSKFPKI